MAASTSSRPVIVGTGLTGCAISRSLSRAGIAHLLVGPSPSAPGLCLGESLNLEGSLDIVDYFPELDERYLAKRAVIAHLGQLQVRCGLDMRGSRLSTLFYRGLGYPRPPEAFLHVDREGFDRAVFDAVRSDPACEHIDAMVAEVEVDADEDSVRALHLRPSADGPGLGPEHAILSAPRAVFDASNHVGVVARHLGLVRERLGPAQRAVWARCVHIGAPDPSAPLWHATHVLRLSRERDGVDAMAWLIPLADRVSIGLGADAHEQRASAELLELALAALVRRGLLVREHFEAPSLIRELPRYEHYRHDRAWGRNWLLAGGTFCLMWFAASAGVSSGFAAAKVAPSFLANPERYGPIYEDLLAKLIAPHQVFEWLRRVDLATTSPAELERRASRLVEQSVLRLAESARLRPGVARHALSGFVGATLAGGAFDLGGICVRIEGSRARQRRAKLAEILDVFAGRAPLARASELIDEDVRVHIDGLSFRGRGAWLTWTRHSHATWDFEDLRFEILSWAHDPQTDCLEVEIVAQAEGRRSEPGRFRYRFEADRVVEIWTSRRNYSFLYGPSFCTLPGFVAHLGHIAWWQRGRAQSREGGIE